VFGLAIRGAFAGPYFLSSCAVAGGRLLPLHGVDLRSVLPVRKRSSPDTRRQNEKCGLLSVCVLLLDVENLKVVSGLLAFVLATHRLI
jgi:hypothetical protein